MASPALDTIGTWGTGSAHSTNSVSATQSTNQTNDVIVAVVYYNNAAVTGSYPNLTSVTASGLTFTLRAKFQYNPSAYMGIETWEAPATSTLSSTVITANFSGNFANAGISIVAINGCVSISAPHDSATLPLSATSTGGGASPTISLTTNQAHDFILCAGTGFDSVGNPCTQSFSATGLSITGISSFFPSGGGGQLSCASQGGGTSSKQSSNVITCTRGLSSAPALVVMVDAYTADAASSPFSRGYIF